MTYTPRHALALPAILRGVADLIEPVPANLEYTPRHARGDQP